MKSRLSLFALPVLMALAAQTTLAQTPTAAPQLVTVRLLRVGGVLALVPAALLWVLSRYRRRDYLRAWVAVWLCLAAPLFVFSTGTGVLDLDTLAGRDTRLAFGRAVSAIAVLTWLGGSALLALSASWIRGAMRWPRHLWTITAGVAIVVVTATVLVGLVVLAAVLWTAGLASLLIGAYRFLQLARRDAFFGALLIGCALITVPLQAGLTQLLTSFAISVPEGVEVWIMVYAILALGMHLVVFEDVTSELRWQNTALLAAQEQLKANAVTDPLTGSYNRRFFREVSAHELKRHQRHAMPLSLLFVDCDRFKTINDERGHETGDRVLQLIAGLLRDRVRHSDYVFRWGGDEFLLMLTCDEQSARKIAQGIQQAFAKRLVEVIGEPPLRGPVALSIGCVSVPPDAVDLEQYIRAVDEQMYTEKARGLHPTV